jgi:hypothetical protein
VSAMSETGYFQLYYLRNKEKILAQHKEYEKTHREEINKRHREWRRRHPNNDKEQQKKRNAQHRDRDNGNSKRTFEKSRARSFVQRHPELLMSACEICDAKENLTAHHPDYAFPTIVVTLCRACHNFVHKGVD